MQIYSINTFNLNEPESPKLLFADVKLWVLAQVGETVNKCWKIFREGIHEQAEKSRAQDRAREKKQQEIKSQQSTQDFLSHSCRQSYSFDLSIGGQPFNRHLNSPV